ncbi:hypothetical protein MIZ03_3289 [Rhodoferax lithotrophicus]|uniref:DUF2325 domain-containing protein n=1 Tax=Rhodoferax lithotrophicus TaxID=2798804 RepID=A0ABM7MQ49_9BURK|nr:DUF2325 domain-containing protein [Rhodoferax sp. MIZ03]BCO28389.1 hypothetical protein MIZ03_3289 [Rhodoferax sp. MIZ03]
MISAANFRAQQVLQSHPLLNPYTHCTPMLLGDFVPGVVRPTLAREARSDVQPQTRSGSGRRKLWELSSNAACLVTGVCLHFYEVQKLACKVGMEVDACSEYDLHGLVSQECRNRCALAELVQRELDSRFALSVQQSQRLKTTEALARWWDDSCDDSDWAGEFWAVLSHPRCSSDLEDIVLGQVHMLEHRASMTVRTAATWRNEILAERQRLAQELASVQQRIQAQAVEHATAVAVWQAECVKMRASVIRAETERDLAQTRLQELKSLEPDVLTRQRLLEDNQRLQAQNEKLLMRVLQRENHEVDKPVLKSVSEDEGKSSLAGLFNPALDLNERQVLCVGGRTSSIPVYREVIEDRGASFMHHDGGEENKASRLVSQLQAADVVICQVGCISHDAYWRVKEHCKRTGKPCLFVEMSGRSALERALGHKVAAAL